jgi:hypothetical protein
MKGITVDTIMSWGPCGNYTRERIEDMRKDICGRRKLITAQDILDAPISDRNKSWVLLHVEFIPERQLHNIAIWCWDKIARPVWEKYYPNDRRPHEAIRIKKLWLEGKANDNDLIAAYAVACDAFHAAAFAAACGAHAAAYAAACGVHAAASGAACGAHAAASGAANPASRDAASAAANSVSCAISAVFIDENYVTKNNVSKKILRHVKKILKVKN